MDPVLIGELLSGLMFFGIIAFLLMGFPVAFTLAGTSLIFSAAGMYFGVLTPPISARWRTATSAI